MAQREYSTERANFIIAGTVQGVCYRLYAADEAGRLGLTGWARNRPDGTVEIMAEGRPDALREFLAWCRQGPPMARVTRIVESYLPSTEEFDSFRIVC